MVGQPEKEGAGRRCEEERMRKWERPRMENRRVPKVERRQKSRGRSMGIAGLRLEKGQACTITYPGRLPRFSIVLTSTPEQEAVVERDSFGWTYESEIRN
jgi:hypothetical protein